jgi:hypothetical protein
VTRSIVAWLRGPLLLFFACLCATGSASPQATPAAAAEDFYRWYLQQIAAQHDPLHDDRAELQRHVAARLLRELDEKSASEDGLDADYFLQAQDFMEGWANHVAAVGLPSKGKTAAAQVSLGDSAQDLRRLRVTLVNEGGVRRIRRVAAAR